MCVDQDGDTNGDLSNYYCYQYAVNECGGYDDEDFIANDICCLCGGGETPTESSDTWEWTADRSEAEWFNWWQGSATEPAEPNNNYRGAAVENCVEMSLEGTWND